MAPTDFFNRLKKLYGKGPEEEVPAISSRAAVALSIGYTLFYVIPFYLSSTTRPSPQLSRDAPSVIRARIRVVTFSCIVISLITYGTIVEKGKATPLEALRLLGYWPISPLDIVKTLALTAILFAGPLYERGIVE
ncbi:MAG: hypothetical protein M1833_000718, partial [Piccolia ochrophora]